MKVAIVGGGVSGVSLSILIADYFDVTLFEKNDRVLKKLLVTGNGRCNFSNKILSRENFHGNNKFLDKFFDTIDIHSAENFLYKLGIVPTVDDRGRIYPLSYQASSVVDAYLLKLKESNVNVKLKSEINFIKVKNEKFVLNNDYSCPYDILVLSPGSMSYPQLGTDGSSYKLAESLGHQKTKLFPGITSLSANIPFLKELKGVKIDGRLIYSINSNKYYKDGDILFTENGISGNTVFETSSQILSNNLSYIIIDFLPSLSEDELFNILLDRKNSFKNRDVLWMMNGLIHKKLANVILKILNIDRKLLLTDIDIKKIKDIVKLIKNFHVGDVKGGSWKQSQVTVGGIDLNNVDFNLQSKLIQNLFFVGEYVDVYGDCGGYNLTFAILSAIHVSNYIRSNYAGSLS